MRHRSKALPLAISLLALGTSCSRTWHFDIVGIDGDLRPRFCISMREKCRGEAVALASFDVSEVIDSTVEGEAHREFKLVWGIQAMRSAPLKEFRYGEVPDGWREDKPAAALEVETLYSVGPYWFTLHAGDPITWTIEENRARGVPAER